jgi:opacity protein-like surface antigen
MYVTICRAARGVDSIFKIFFCVVVGLVSAGTDAIAADLPLKAPPPAPWNWTGFYLGAHTGGALDLSHVSDPYGATLFGDGVRSPGALFGAQVGYDWQNGPWVFGGQADVTWTNMDGTFTCLQPARDLAPLPPAGLPGFAGGAYGATCQVRPHWFGTVTGRIGRVLGPEGRMLVYAKGGLAWMQGRVDMAVNNIRAGTDGPENVLVSSDFTDLGWTAGAGLEYALGGHWSLMLEYDYLRFDRHDLATPDAPLMAGLLPGIAGSSAPSGRTAGISQDVHAMKLGLNYRFGDRPASLSSSGPIGFVPTAGVVNSVEVEVGTRYVHGWGRYQQDLGGGPPLPVNNSRLTWDHLQTDGAELFARIDTAENVMLKGMIGGGAGNLGYINDEDWGLQQPFPGTAVSVFPYQNSISGASTDIRYLTIDAGYDWLRQPAYRFTPFVGYNYFEQHLQTPKTLDYIMYAPTVTYDTVGLGQDNNWHAVRIGAAADILLAPRLHLNAEAAYLPYVHYRGHDDHGPGAVSPQWGDGRGVQLEAILSYDVTDRWSVGVGGRYWAFWIPNGETANFANGGTGAVNAQAFAAEQAAAFLQVSYKFGVPWSGYR